MKRRAVLASIFSLCTSCLGETSAQEPIPLFDIEDKEPQAPVDPPDPGPPTHPTAPPPKPQPLVFAPGQLPWAPAGYTVYFHLKEEAEWSSKYPVKTEGTYPNTLTFHVEEFVEERYYSGHKFEAILFPESFFEESKTIHFFEKSSQFPHYYKNKLISNGHQYYFQMNPALEDYFLQKFCMLTVNQDCADITGFFLQTKDMSKIKSAEVFQVKSKIKYLFGEIIIERKELEDRHPNIPWEDSCRKLHFAVYDHMKRFGDMDAQACVHLLISIESKDNDFKTIHKINP